ncbi:hypothetical protein [Conexibacter arvalis]|uniref:Uncharacterized protein n=1 Tax=Conexibacter arvalis TaxID=912552 RepID=A0A840I892_9ACTN|nr:hypothetical protein [Conexibacter arvalis]MBB4660742.1 hypothetical protein [Conexibacter arvalis]
MTVTRDPPRAPSAPAPDGDPLARVGRQLIEAERRLRWRRSRRRIAGGTAAGALLVAALAVALVPGGPLGGAADDTTLRGDRGAPTVRGNGSGGSGAALAVRGDVRLRFSVRWGASADAVVLERVRARLAAVGYPAAEVRGDGSRVAAGMSWTSGRGGRANQRVQIGAALGAGQLAFYDWEESVVDRDGRPIASRTDARSLRTSMMAGQPGAGMSLADAEAAAERVPGPTAIVQALGPDGMGPGRDDPRARFHVLRGRPPLTGADVERVRAVPRGSGGPAVRYAFRAEAHARVHELTRAVSRRGQALLRPGLPELAAVQHVAIIVDDRLLGVVAIDPMALPDGIDGRSGLDVTDGMTAERATMFAAGLNAMGGPLPPLTPPVFERGGG